MVSTSSSRSIQLPELLTKTSGGETGIFSVIPTNIFAALSSNDSVRVLIFAVIFGIGMVMTERQSGHSIFGALRHARPFASRFLIGSASWSR